MDIPKSRSVLKDKTALVVGAGGLGGFVIEHLARSGMGTIIVMDGDSFEPSNLNRQLLCTLNNLGRNKAVAAVKRIKEISEVSAIGIPEFFCGKNAFYLERADVVIDCVDNIETRLNLEEMCAAYKKTLIHGAVCADEGQVAVIKPGEYKLRNLYHGQAVQKPETISHCVAAVSSLQVSEAIKFLLGGKTAEGLILINLFNLELKTLDIH